MKWGMRRPSLRGRISARTSLKRYVRQSMGLKVPKGWGWLTNPKKAMYNRVYHRTTFGIDSLLRPRRRSSSGCLIMIVATVALGIMVGMILR